MAVKSSLINFGKSERFIKKRRWEVEHVENM